MKKNYRRITVNADKRCDADTPEQQAQCMHFEPDPNAPRHCKHSGASSCFCWVGVEDLHRTLQEAADNANGEKEGLNEVAIPNTPKNARKCRLNRFGDAGSTLTTPKPRSAVRRTLKGLGERANILSRKKRKYASVPVICNACSKERRRSRLSTKSVKLYWRPVMETVKIGKLEWSKRNLDIVVDDSWDYDNDPANREKYGRLYTWGAAIAVVAMLGDGWRLPTRKDWNNLVKAAGGEDVAGDKLKSTSGWDNNGNGTDDFGFSALPGGYRNTKGDCTYYGDYGYYGGWWTATEFCMGCAYNRYMFSDSSVVYEFRNYTYNGLSNGQSVRCVRDAVN